MLELRFQEGFFAKIVVTLDAMMALLLRYLLSFITLNANMNDSRYLDRRARTRMPST